MVERSELQRVLLVDQLFWDINPVGVEGEQAEGVPRRLVPGARSVHDHSVQGRVHPPVAPCLPRKSIKLTLHRWHLIFFDESNGYVRSRGRE